ncbi:tail assembly chaperone [Staphylococcus saprophyticus]|nr:tail assembly chaperone [Staphylococcus saprophyticus]
MEEFNMVEMIKTLTVNGKEVEAKGSLMFDIEAKKFSEKDKENTVPGFNVVYNKLINKDNEGILDFWQCATSHLADKPSKEDIFNAIQNVIEEKQDTKELLAGALDVMTNSGFFKQKTRQYWMNVSNGEKMAKKEEKEQAKIGHEMMVENYKDIMGVEPLLTSVK